MVPSMTPATVAVVEAARLQPLASSYRWPVPMPLAWQLSESPRSRRGTLLRRLLQRGSAWCRPSVQQVSIHTMTLLQFQWTVRFHSVTREWLCTDRMSGGVGT
jgi:hypothetical protein